MFVHLYSAGHDPRDRRLLSKQIPSTIPNGINILVFWRSGHFLQVSNTTKQFIVTAGRYPYVTAARFVTERVTKALVGQLRD